MDYFELECAVEAWAEERGIFEKATPHSQVQKTVSELEELIGAIQADDKEEIKDGIGDIVVTLIIQCKMQNVTLEECLEHAYNQIKDRKGKMIDGQFVKEQ